MKKLTIWLAAFALVIGVCFARDDDTDQLVADTVVDAQRAARHDQAGAKARVKQAARLAHADNLAQAEHAARRAVADLIASARLIP